MLWGDTYILALSKAWVGCRAVVLNKLCPVLLLEPTVLYSPRSTGHTRARLGAYILPTTYIIWR